MSTRNCRYPGIGFAEPSSARLTGVPALADKPVMTTRREEDFGCSEQDRAARHFGSFTNKCAGTGYSE